MALSHYSPKQVAQALGVSESSVKRWCDLGTVPVLRTAGGHRRISRQSFEALVRQAGGLPTGAVGDVPRLAPPNFGREATHPDREPSPRDGGRDTKEACISPAQARTEFHDALRLGLEDRCRGLLNDLIASGFSRTAAADWLVTDAMHRFGHLWERGEMAIYQERRACGICLGLIHELRLLTAPSSDAPIAIGGTPRGDIYQIPTALVELALCEHGWRATSLGCNLPMESFASALSEYHPKLIWISLSSVEDEEELVQGFNRLADSLDGRTALLIGGRGAGDQLRPRLRYTAHCDNLVHLIELASRL